MIHKHKQGQFSRDALTDEAIDFEWPALSWLQYPAWTYLARLQESCLTKDGMFSIGSRLLTTTVTDITLTTRDCICPEKN